MKPGTLLVVGGAVSLVAQMGMTRSVRGDTWGLADLEVDPQHRLYASDINNAAQVVGSFETIIGSDQRTQSFLLEGTAFQPLDILIPTAPVHGPYVRLSDAAQFIDNQGRVVGWATVRDKFENYKRGSYILDLNTGVIQNVGPIVGILNRWVDVFDVSNAGVVGREWVDDLGSGYPYPPGKVEGAPQGTVLAINNLGHTITSLYQGSGIVYEYKGIDGPLPPASLRPLDLNDSDQIAGDLDGRGVLYDHGATTFIDPINQFTALQIKEMNSGGAVAGKMTMPSGRSHAFVYMDGKVLDLNDLIPASSGWALTEVIGINDQGQILGNGYVDGDARTFLLTPGQTGVPARPTGDSQRLRKNSYYWPGIWQWTLTGGTITRDYTYVPDGQGVVVEPGVDLSGKNLTKAYLIEAELAGANFTGTQLTTAMLREATLKDATFTNAVVTGANFEATTGRGFTAQQLYSTASYQAKDLRGIALGLNKLAGWDFAGQDLRDASFWNADLTGATFAGANLGNAQLSWAVLDGTNFAGADIAGADLYRVTRGGFTKEQLYSTGSYAQKDLRGVNLGGNDLSGWDLSGQDLTGADLTNATLTGTNLAGAVIAESNLAGAFDTGLTPAQLYSTASYAQGDLHGIDLSGNDLTGYDLRGKSLAGARLESTRVTGPVLKQAILTDARLRDADLRSADFTGTRLEGADLRGAQLAGAGFAGAFIAEANLEDAVSHGFTSVMLYVTASYKNRDLHGIVLAKSDLTGWTFYQQDLVGARFAAAMLKNADLRGANLAGADLTGATLAGAHLEDATIAGAKLGGTVALGLSKAQVYSTASYQGKSLDGIDLSDNDLKGWDFAGQSLEKAKFWRVNLSGASLKDADLTEASFYTSTLTGVDLSGAVIRGASFLETPLTAAQFYSTESYQQKELRGLTFRNMDASGWDFSGQNLEKASFNGGSVAGANFTGARIAEAQFLVPITPEQLASTASYAQRDLHGVELSSVDLRAVDLRGMDMSNCRLWAVRLDGAALNGANMSGAYVTSSAVIAGANLSMARLAGTHFGSRMSLAQTNFAGADLRGAVFDDEPSLTGTDFSGADLRGVQRLALPENDPTRAITRNTIRPDGTIHGLSLGNDEVMAIRDYAGDVPIGIQDQVSFGDGSVLRMLFEDAEWGSTISFEPDIAVMLGGTLNLSLADGVNPAGLAGRTFRLFDWTGVDPNGTFNIVSSLPWDTSHLYDEGIVTLVPEPGAFGVGWIVALMAMGRRRARGRRTRG